MCRERGHAFVAANEERDILVLSPGNIWQVFRMVTRYTEGGQDLLEAHMEMRVAV